MEVKIIEIYKMDTEWKKDFISNSKNKICPIIDCNNQIKDVANILNEDKRYFISVCDSHNDEIDQLIQIGNNTTLIENSVFHEEKGKTIFIKDNNL